MMYVMCLAAVASVRSRHHCLAEDSDETNGSSQSGGRSIEGRPVGDSYQIYRKVLSWLSRDKVDSMAKEHFGRPR
jgi:hypothetical protein